MIVEWPRYAMANVAKFIFSGAFDAFPSLDLVVQEAGVYWIPLLAHRADELYVTLSGEIEVDPHMWQRERKKFDRLPSRYVFDNVYSTTQPVPLPSRQDGRKALFDSCRSDETMMFSTDFPHHSFDAPNWLFKPDVIDAATRTAIASKNAKKVFHFD